MRLSLAFWRPEAWSEHPERLLSAATLPPEAPDLVGGGAWSVVGGPITVVSEVSGTMDWSRTFGGDGGVAISGSAVNAEISAAKAGTDVGGSFLSSDVIIQGWVSWSRPEAAGEKVPGW